MSVGELTVSIIGDISKLSRAFSQASSEVGKFGSSVTSMGSSMTSKLGGGLSAVATAAAVTGTALGVGLVAAGTKSLSMFNDFEKSVSNAASVTGLAGDAFAAAKENISAVAQELGQKTAFSSSQAADALYNLASAGVDVSQITSSQLVPVLNLASGTQYDLAATTAAVTSTLSQFGLGFESAGRVADVFAKDAGLTQASMDKLSLSMNYVGTIANTCGISLETTSASLGVLYNAGMDGSTAGTSLRGVLASLVTPTDAAASTLASMGLTIADVNPTTNNFTDIVQKLADKGLSATQAFEIFGRESAPAILALTSKSGDLKTLTTELENAGGAAQTMADQQLDTLAGSWDSFTGSIENLWINVGQALAPTARTVIDSLNSMVPSIQTWIVTMVQGFVDFVGKLGSSVNAITVIGSTIIDVFKNVFSAISGGGSGIGDGLTNTINSIFSTVARIVTSAAPMIQNAIIGIINFFKSLSTGISPVVSDVSVIIGNIVNVFKAFFSGMSGSVSSSGVVGAISGVVTTISGALSMFSDVVSWALVSIAPTVKNIFSGIVDTIKGFIPSFSTANDLLGRTFERMPFVIEGAVAKLTPAWNVLKEKFNELKPLIENAITGLNPVWNKLKSSFDIAFKNIKKFISDYTLTWDQIKNGWNELKLIFDNSITALQPVWDRLKDIFDAGVNVFNEFIANIGPAWDNVRESWGVLKDIFGELKTAIGDNLKTVLETVAPQLKGFLNALSGTEIGNASGWGKTLAGVLEYLSGKIKDFLVYIKEHPEIIKFAADIVTMGIMVIGALPGVIGAIVNFAIGVKDWLTSAVNTVQNTYNTWKQRWEDIKTAVQTAVSSIVGIVLSWINTLANYYAMAYNAVQTLKSNLKTIWDVITASFESSKTLIVNAVTGLYNGLVSAYNSIITSLSTFKNNTLARWAEIKAGILAKLNELITDAQTWIQKQVNKYNDAIAKINVFKTQVLAKWSEIKTGILAKLNELISDAQNWITKQLAKYNDAIAKLSNFKTQALARWTEIKAGILAKLNEIISDAQNWITKQVAKLNDMVSKYNTFKTQVTTKWTEIKTAIKTKLDEIVTEIKNKASSIESALGSIVTKIENKVSDFKNAGKKIMQGLVDGIEEKIDDIKDSINGVITWIDNHLPHSPAKEGPLSKLPNWDAVFVDPLASSIANIKSMSSPLESSLSGLRSPLDASISSGLNNIQNVSNVNSSSTTVEGNKYSIGPITVRNDNDLQALIAAVKTSIANDRRKAGIL